MILVTGANGFIGSALVWDLNQHGYKEIICVDTVPIQDRSNLLAKVSYAQFVHRDDLFHFLENSENTKNLACIFHMGACSSTLEMDINYLRKNNTEYTQHLFEVATKLKLPFIYASSGATYGDGLRGFDDCHPPENFTPLNPYGWSKLNFDIWALKQKQVPPLWYGLRFFNVFGPNEYHKEEMCSVVYKAFNQITEAGSLKLFKSNKAEYEDGCQLRDFIYVKDITRWMIELFKQSHAESGIYNLGFGKARTWIDLARAVFDNLERRLNIDWIDIPVHLKEQYQYFTEANMDHWQSQNLSEAKWSLEAAIEDYIKNYLVKKDPFL